MKIPPEKELLELLGKSDWQAWNDLNWIGIVQNRKCPSVFEHDEGIESLADLSYRLWKQAIEKTGVTKLEKGMLAVAGHKKVQCEFMWKFYYTSIDRIVAALIALGRAGIEI